MKKTADALKSVEKRLADMAVLMKHVTTYQKQTVYEAYCRGKGLTHTGQSRKAVDTPAKGGVALAAEADKLPNLAPCRKNTGSPCRKKPFTLIMASEKTGGLSDYIIDSILRLEKTGTGQGNKRPEISIKAVVG